jgi:hypothetical protein
MSRKQQRQSQGFQSHLWQCQYIIRISQTMSASDIGITELIGRIFLFIL